MLTVQNRLLWHMVAVCVCRVQTEGIQTSAADSHADSHECPECPSTLHHGLPHSSHQLPAAHPDPKGNTVRDYPRGKRVLLQKWCHFPMSYHKAFSHIPT